MKISSYHKNPVFTALDSDAWADVSRSKKFISDKFLVMRIIERSKFPLTIRQIKNVHDTYFLADILDELQSDGFLFVDKSNPLITKYSRREKPVEPTGKTLTCFNNGLSRKSNIADIGVY